MHNLKEGMVILQESSIGTIKLINVAARQMLNLPFDGEADSQEFFKRLSLYPIELGTAQESAATSSG